MAKASMQHVVQTFQKEGGVGHVAGGTCSIDFAGHAPAGAQTSPQLERFGLARKRRL